jgi:branched-chain amino acid transport system ATP-binding protein
VSLALKVADEAAVLNRGTIVVRGAADELRHDGERIERAYFGDPEAATARSAG